jgi:hypothetical protein
VRRKSVTKKTAPGREREEKAAEPRTDKCTAAEDSYRHVT